jgi:hypothetical protein
VKKVETEIFSPATNLIFGYDLAVNISDHHFAVRAAQ